MSIINTKVESLFDKIDLGIKGHSVGIPLPIPKLSKVINGLRPKTYTLYGGLSGSGKTSTVDYLYIVGLYEYILKHPELRNKLKIFYFSMERSTDYKLAKWLALKIKIDHDFNLDVADIIGWNEPGKMGEHRSLLESYIPYLNDLLSFVDIYEGSLNPTGVRNICYKHLQNPEIGEIVKIDEHRAKYTPVDPSIINLGIIDHLGCLKKEKELRRGKETIDKMVEYVRVLRDFYNMAWVDISQVNRSISDPQRLRMGDVELQPDDFKESSEPFESCDICVSLFDPSRYKLDSFMNYSHKYFMDNGIYRFRAIKVLKNSFGIDNVRIPTTFFGESGLLEEIPLADKLLTQQDYKNLLERKIITI